MATWRIPGLDDTQVVAPLEEAGVSCRHAVAAPRPLCAASSSAGEAPERSRYVMQAWRRSHGQFVDAAVNRQVAESLRSAVQLIQPRVRLAIEDYIVRLMAGKMVGAGLETSVRGLGKSPHIGVGKKARRASAGWLLGHLGLWVTARHVEQSLSEEADGVARGIQLAFASHGSPPTINIAAHHMAQGTVAMALAIVRGAIAYAGKQGLTTAMDQLSRSALGTQFSRLLRTDPGIRHEVKVDFWLHRMGMPKKPRGVRERLAIAVEFLEKVYPEQKLLGYLRGIDFSKPVNVIGLVPPFQLPEVGQTIDSYAFRHYVLVQYYHGNFGLSNYFTWLRGGAPLTRLGIAEGPREMRFYVVKRPIQALASFASAINDTWTMPAKVRVLVRQRNPNTGQFTGQTVSRLVEKGEFVAGGGQQLIIPVSRTGADALVELAVAR